MKRFATLSLAAAVAASAFSAASAGVTPLPRAARSSDGLSTSLAVDAGWLSGKAKEHVFANVNCATRDIDGRRHQISRLEWDLDDVFLAGVAGSLRSGVASFNFGVWGGAGRDGAGDMFDYDWQLGDTPEQHGELADGASDLSKSEATVTLALIADANVSVDLLGADSAFALYPFVGVRYERFKWDGEGGTAVYWDEFEGYYPHAFEDGETIIEYRQEYFQPYAGLGGSLTAGPVVLSAYGRIAPVYWGKDHDNHCLRGYVTEDETDWEAFDDVAYGAGVRAEVALTEALSLEAAFDWTRYALAEAETKTLQSDDDDDDDGAMPAGARSFGGVELETATLSAGLVFRF